MTDTPFWPEWLPALQLSVQVATAATVLATIIALPVAFIMSRHKSRFGWLIESIMLLPLVMPPTVVGYALVYIMGRQGIVGSVVLSITGESLLFTQTAAVIAATIVALPLVYLPARAGFASIDRDLEDEARLNGAGTLAVFFRVSIPLARRLIASGVALAFARAIGEFGATVMVLGIGPGRLTLPISVYANYEAGKLSAALPAVIVLMVISVAIALTYQRLLRK